MTILSPTAEQVRRVRQATNLSLHAAQQHLLRENAKQHIRQAQTVTELREVLLAMVEEGLI